MINKYDQLLSEISDLVDAVKKCDDNDCDAYHSGYDDGFEAGYDQAEKRTGERMNFNEYADKAQTTAVYPNIGSNIYYPVLGLCGEAGELANKVKKIMRDEDGVLTEEIKNDLSKELGDVLWYVAMVSKEIGRKLDWIAEENIIKLASRKERGVIQGSGDTR